MILEKFTGDVKRRVLANPRSCGTREEEKEEEEEEQQQQQHQQQEEEEEEEERGRERKQAFSFFQSIKTLKIQYSKSAKSRRIEFVQAVISMPQTVTHRCPTLHRRLGA